MQDWLAPFLSVRHEGLYAPAFEAFLDPPTAVPRAILSHAHSDHAAAGHGEVWATPETLALYRRRHPEWRGAARELRPGEELEQSGCVLRFHAAGHILGSAQVWISGSGESLLYTGDFKRRIGRTAAPVETPHATTLLTECTFGLPVFRFPGREELESRLLGACREALAEKKTPVLLAYALGKAQEAAAILTEAGIPTVLHGAAWKLLPDYADAGIPLPLSRAYESGPAEPGEVLIVPPNCSRTAVVQKLKSRRVVYLSGWAVREAARAEFDADVLLPMSDHADFEDLLRHATLVRAATCRGDARLRGGFRADSPRTRDRRCGPRGGRRAASGRRMTIYRLIAEALEAVAATRGKLAKIEILASALAGLEGEDLVIGARLLSGSPFAEWEEQVTSAGWATVGRAASAVTEWDLETIGACARAIGDLGEAVGLLLGRPAGDPLSIRDVDAHFRKLATLRKAVEKQTLLEALLRRAAPVEGKYLLKTLSGGLRIGADATTVEEAVAVAFGAEREAVARARRDSGDIGETADAARTGRLSEIHFRLFHPIGFMLATPIEDAADVAEELPLLAVEDKFDGIRAHAHKAQSRVALFSRTLDEVTRQFPDVAAALSRIPGSFLLDGEIVAWRADQNRPDSFFKLQRRLGRKAPPDDVLAEIPAAFIAYDCLAVEDEPLFEKPWSARRQRLEAVASGTALRLSDADPRRNRGGARGGVRGRPRARQRGARPETDRLPLPGRQARQAVAKVEEGGGHPGRRRHRRRAGARQARRNALGLHLRGPRRRPLRQHREGLLGPDRRGDPRAREALSADHDGALRPGARGLAGNRDRGVLRLHPEERPPQVRLRPAVPAASFGCARTRPRETPTRSRTFASSTDDSSDGEGRVETFRAGQSRVHAGRDEDSLVTLRVMPADGWEPPGGSRKKAAPTSQSVGAGKEGIAC